MKGHPVAFTDPAYDGLEAAVSAKLGLPEGLLTAIRTKGERTNADEVSSAGARTVYQIIPQTRRSALKKWGIDPYASAENAAEVAGRILKDSLNATKGDVVEAVARYHAGTEGARGRVNRAYVERVTGAPPAGGSAFDRAKAARQADAGPSIAKVYEAYKSGKMSPEDRQAFEADVNSGAVLLPRGAKVEAPAQAAAVLPAGAVVAYNTHSDMSDGERAQIDQDLKEGLIKLPQGAKLARPGPRTFGESFGMGVRTDARALAGMADIPAGGLNAAINIPFVLAGKKAPLSTTPFGDMANSGADLVGLATPATSGEKLIDALGQGAVQGIATAGMALPLAGAKGAVGAVAKGLSSAPIIDTVAGSAGGGAAETAREHGAGPLGQLAAGVLVGGATGVGAAGVAERLAPKFGPKVAQIVETTPRPVMMDEAGQFTDDGREIVARAGAEPEQVKAAYDEAATPQAEQGGQTVRVFEGVEHPVEVVGAAERNAADGRDYVPVRTPDGQEGYVPADEVITKPAAETPAPEAPRAPEAAPTPEAPLPASAAARMAQAEQLGVKLTKGQATKDFETQAAENDLSGTNTAEGRAVREHLDRQTQAIKDAAEAFKASVGDTSLSAADRGAAVKAGLRDLAEQGKAGVTQAYKLVRDLASELGDNAKGLTALDPAPIRAAVREILADDTVSDATRRGLSQIAAKYALIGEKPKHVPDTGMTTVMVRDAENNLVKGPAFAGKVEPLDLTNAEKFRQRLNDLYDKMATRNPQEALKPVLDDAVAAAAERAAKEGFGDVGKAATQARDAFKAQKATFEAKDVVDSLISWKKGTQTDAVLPEKVWSLVFGQGPDALTNIKKLRAILLSNPTETSKAAWAAIQAQSVADLFQKALVVNGNGGEGAISGAKLNTAVQQFGPKKLKLILGDERFDSFMRLKRVIGDATIPLPKTTNPSGSGHLIARFLGNTAKAAVTGARLVPGVGGVVDVVAGLAKSGAERAQAERVAESAVNFSAEQAAAVDAKAAPKPDASPKSQPLSPDQAIRQFLELGSSNRLLAPLLASSAASQEEGDR